jgi:hypothetical protein
LRDDGVVVADHAREELVAGLQLLDQVVADFLLHGARLAAVGLPQIAERLNLRRHESIVL